jgi:hypothetical protein
VKDQPGDHLTPGRRLVPRDETGTRDVTQ